MTCINFPHLNFDDSLVFRNKLVRYARKMCRRIIIIGRRREGDLPNLPEDVLIDKILVRLPVKSLIRFKCVCKNWYNLIESPHFARNHFHNPNNHTRLLVRHYIPDSHVTEDPLALAIFPFLEEEQGRVVHEDIIDFIQLCPYRIHIIGPVNGLFLLHTDFNGSTHDRLALWNPATAKFRRLPKPKLRFQRDFPRSNVIGFGWDPLREDYKVVWCPTFWPSARSDLAAVALYTHGNESWRQIDNPDVLDSVRNIWWRCSGYCREYFSGVYLNGAFYWLVQCGCGQQIVLFDMGRDVFRKIPAPHNLQAPYWGHNLLVQNDDDSIALLENEYVPPTTTTLKLKSINIWVMRQEGCWTKHFTLECETMVQIQHPLGFWKNNTELFVETATNELALCDLNNHIIKYLGVHGRGRDRGHGRGYENSSFLRVFKYKESVVSVKAGQMENWKRAKLHDIIWDFYNMSYADEYDLEAGVQERAKND